MTGQTASSTRKTDTASNAWTDTESADAKNPPRLLTVGHSNRELDEFIDLLTNTGTEVVVDVRRLPGSNRNPQFNAETLVDDLAEHSIELRRLEGLTGRRPVSHTVPFETNAWWQNRSFHNYADHCLSEDFRTDLDTLIEWSKIQRLAIMCSEAVWWRCHVGSSPTSCLRGRSRSRTSSVPAMSMRRSSARVRESATTANSLTPPRLIRLIPDPHSPTSPKPTTAPNRALPRVSLTSTGTSHRCNAGLSEFHDDVGAARRYVGNE